MGTTPVWRLDWDESLSMCIPEIDSEHRRFIRLVNDLNEAIVDRLGRVELQKRMQRILDDAAEHFAHEEALFRKWHYPNAEEHAMKHAAVTRALHDIMGQFNHNGSEYEWVAAGLKVKQALVDHLLNEDMKYRDYCCIKRELTEARCEQCPSRKASEKSDRVAE
jgi:hemerythrin-like metal-binding protein